MRKIQCLIICLIISLIGHSCESEKKIYSQKRGLMLLKSSEQPMNKKLKQGYRRHVR